MITVKQDTNTCDVYITGAQSIAAFKTLINRALNTYTDAPAEIKEFGDMLLTGHILQNYRIQNTPNKRII